MKVLVVATPGSGHINPMLPLIEAFLAQGDAVTVAAGEDPGGAVARAGATFHLAGRGELDWFQDLQARVLHGSPGDGIAAERINHYFYPRLFAEIAAPDMIDDVVALGRRWHPDLVVFETYALAGPLAAEVLGVPGVHHLISPMLPHEVSELADDAVSPMWRSFDRCSPGYGGLYQGITIELSPSSLERLTVPAGESMAMRPVPVPDREPVPADPPCVYLTLGTFFGGNTQVFRAVLAGLAEEDLEVVVTIGAGNDPAALDPVRQTPMWNAMSRSANYFPGARRSSTMAVPAPCTDPSPTACRRWCCREGAEQLVNGELLASCGAGLSIGPEQLTPAAARDAVRSVLTDPAFHQTARRLGEQIAALPDPATVARGLRERFGAG